ncbi:hypothetical protein FIBSPDRAFT_26244 [Athelia psychrophila]|uniref:Uncharacterized protein n=1 Tax=Athelia psychrophila TaxID=1759441 RepID=A0A166G494_9AGAM|nr:hypothetical protein FIBSPDRAFT_26244 [Fibularhizoctonia sp. CBS 109695]
MQHSLSWIIDADTLPSFGQIRRNEKITSKLAEGIGQRIRLHEREAVDKLQAKPVAFCIIRTAKELRWTTVAMYTAQDTNAVFASEAVKLHDVFWFMSPKRIVDIAKRTQAPTYTQATVSSARVLRSPPFFPPANLDDQMTARVRHCAHLLSCDLAVAQDVPAAPCT